MGLSWVHILVVVLIAVLLFGRGRFSALMGDLAQGIRSFKQGMTEDEKPARDPRVIEHQALRGAESAKTSDTAGRA